MIKAPSWYRPESERYLHLDVLRFFASVAIVVFHYRALMDWVQPPMAKVALDGLRFAVDLFFVISGVMMGDLYRTRLTSRAAYGEFLRRRAARLLPLHYATLFLCIAIAEAARVAGFGLSSPEVFEHGCIVPNLLLLQSFNTCHHLSFNGPSWSISAEAAMYLLLPVLLLLSRNAVAALVIVAGLVATLFMMRGPLGTDWTNWTYDFGVVRALPSFLLGLVLSRADRLLARITGAHWWLLAAVIGFFLSISLLANDVVSLSLGYGIVLFGLAADRQGACGAAMRAIAPLGRLTYSLYMLHMPVALVAISGIGKHLLKLSGAGLNGWVVLVGLTLLPVVSLASFVWVEGPTRRWISGR